jgi:transcriptional regulator with XRE-family HTH domain
MFYERLIELCEQSNISLTAALKEIGLSASKGTQWKAGAIPSSINLSKLANYFDVSTDYLLGADDIKKRPASEDVERLKDYFKSDRFKSFADDFMSLSEEDQRKVAEYMRFLDSEHNSQDD